MNKTATNNLFLTPIDIQHVKDYIAPRGELARLPIPNIASICNKQKKPNFIDEHTKAKKVVQSPDKYVQIHNWCDLKEDKANRPKGRFLLEPRATHSEAIFVENKKRPTPSTHSYEPLKCFKYTQGKINGNYLQKSIDKSIHMTDEEANILLSYPGAGKHEAIDLYKFKHESPKKWKI